MRRNSLNSCEDLKKETFLTNWSIARITDNCDGIVVRISTASRIREVGFYDNDHIEVLKYVLSGDGQTGVTAASVLSEWDAR